jgi:hypothetical protein
MVNEHHLRQVLTEYLAITTPPGRTVPSASSHRVKLTPGRRSRSTSPTTRSAENKSPADSHTSTRPPHDRPTPLREDAGYRPDRVFEPNTMDHERGAAAREAGARAGHDRCDPSEGTSGVEDSGWMECGPRYGLSRERRPGTSWGHERTFVPAGARTPSCQDGRAPVTLRPSRSQQGGFLS